MTDEPIRSGEFNTAMKGIKDALVQLSERVAQIESLNQASLLTRVSEAKKDGEAQGAQATSLASLEKRVDRLSTTMGIFAFTFAGQLMWWLFQRVANK